MKYKFVGGSLDGDEKEVHPLTNYRIRIPHPVEHDFEAKPYVAEIYEIVCPHRAEYHFVGYEK